LSAASIGSSVPKVSQQTAWKTNLEDYVKKKENRDRHNDSDQKNCLPSPLAPSPSQGTCEERKPKKYVDFRDKNKSNKECDA
jgi:hypothetical protein